MTSSNPRNQLSIEIQLLLACARSDLGEHERTRVQQIAHDAVDWERWIDLCEFHRVVPLAAKTFAAAHGDTPPEIYRQQLQATRARIASHNLFLMQELSSLINLLDCAGIPAIPYKGPTLALLAYSNIGLRQFGDLDVLVDGDDYQRAQDVLLRSGFKLESELSWECTLTDSDNRVSLDLHRALIPDRFPTHLEFDSLFRRTSPLALGGRQLNVLGPEDYLIVLSIQLSKDAWGFEFVPLRLIKVCDINELVRRYPNMDWELIEKTAKKRGCLRMVRVALGVASQLFELQLPERLAAGVPERELRIVDRLVEDVMNKLTNQETPKTTPLLSMSEFHFQVRERARDRLSPIYHGIRAVLGHWRKHNKTLETLTEPIIVIYHAILRSRRSRRSRRRDRLHFR